AERERIRHRLAEAHGVEGEGGGDPLDEERGEQRNSASHHARTPPDAAAFLPLPACGERGPLLDPERTALELRLAKKRPHPLTRRASARRPLPARGER